ncbi:restriction endonuclease subunit S [Lactococcus garvieae]|uniref:restriction endonuclease subunit S n=1 Tax=Lactococcus garvieae TaxID=1363 RepID=UPI0038537E1D
MSKKSPQLRFEGFTDDWEERKLKDVSTYIRGSFPQPYTNPDFYDETNGKPFVQVADIGYDLKLKPDTKSHISKLAESKSRFVEAGKVVVALQGSIETSIGRTAITQYDAFFDRTILIFQEYKVPIDKQYFSQIIKKLFEREKERAWGATISTITKEHLNDFIVGVPSIEEQQKIGSFFKQLDDIIALHQRKLDMLKEQKKGYLQKMFPKNGAKVPELRFAGFADDWEERKLSSGLREYTDRVIVEDDKEYYQISVRNNFGGITLRGSKMGNKIGRKRQAKINLTKYPQTLIFTRQTVEQGGIGWVDKYCDGAIVTENMPTISLDTSVFSKYFLTNLFQTRIFYKNAILDNIEGGSAQIAIHESKFLSSTLLFPNLDEQEKIGQFFKQLDDTIDLHQRKLDLLKEQKKGFLQKMFV